MSDSIKTYGIASASQAGPVADGIISQLSNTVLVVEELTGHPLGNAARNVVDLVDPDRGVVLGQVSLKLVDLDKPSKRPVPVSCSVNSIPGVKWEAKQNGRSGWRLLLPRSVMRQVVAGLSIAGVASALFSPASALAQSLVPDSGPPCAFISGVCQISAVGATGPVDSTGQQAAAITSTFTTPNLWGPIDIFTVGGNGGPSDSDHPNGGAGAGGSAVSATVGSQVSVSGARPSFGLLRLVSLGGNGAGAQSGAVDAGTAGVGGAGGSVTLAMNGAITSSDPTTPGIFASSVGGTVLPSQNGGAAEFAGKSNHSGESGPMNVTIGGSVNTAGVGALIVANGGAGVNGASDTGGLLSSDGRGAGFGGSATDADLVQVTVSGKIASSAGDGIDVLANGGNGGIGGTASGSADSDGGGYGGDGGISAPAWLTISGSVTGAAKGAIAQSVGGNGGVGGDGNGATNDGSSSGGNGGAGGGSLGVSVAANGTVNGVTNIVSGISGGGDGGAGGSSTVGSSDIGGNGGIGGNGNNANVRIGEGGAATLTGAPHTATTGVSAISFGGAGGAGASAGGILFASGGAGGNGGAAGVASVLVGPGATISTLGDDLPPNTSSVAPGVLVRSNGGAGGAGNSAAGLGAAAGGAGFGGAGGTASATIDGSISTTGSFAHGVLAQSLGGEGAGGGDATAIFASRGGNAQNGGKGGNVYVSGTGGSINTTGTGSAGVIAQSVGGGGGSGGNATTFGNLAIGGNGGAGGDGQSVTVGYSASDSSSGILSDVITTHGESANGIVAQSIGDGGGNGGNAFAAGAEGSLSIGGDAKGGGSGGAVVVQNDGLVTTFGNQSGGIAAQSVGGGGGNGGSAVALSAGVQVSTSVAIGGSAGAGQSGGAVTVTNNGQVSTYGADAYGVKAQSIGGGGGQGGTALAGAAALGGDPEFPTASVTVAIGGSGGAGGDQSNSPVTVTNNGLITTAGDGSIGVIAQNVSGGGGNGGDSTAASYANGGGDGTNISASAAVGGKGGAGGTAGTVTFNGNGGLIATLGADAYGIFAQSVAGGGGVGGTGDSSASSGAGDSSYTGSIAVGGSGGSGGTGGAVLINNDGSANQSGTGTNILTMGDGANAIFAQSIGGGGGASGGGTAKAKGGDLNLGVSVGGNAGNGGVGGAVTVKNTGVLVTKGADADAIFAQSVGGGGGKAGKGASTNGGAADPATITTDMTNALINGLGSGVPGGATQLSNGAIKIGSDVWKALNTVSKLENAFGGSDGAVSSVRHLTDDGDDDNADNLTLNASIGGKGGSGGVGGQVNVNNQGAVETDGIKSDAIFAQSVGGGGGVGGASSFSGAVGSMSALLKLGGDGVAGAPGGTVTVNNTGEIATTGVASYGIDAQSVGGGGGKGGVTGSPTGALKSLGVILGGSGGSGGDGNTVNVSNDNLIATSGRESMGILAQSVGGGGGTAHALSNDIGVAAGSDTPKVFVTLGGSGGAGGNGGAVNVTMGNTAPGQITTSGTDAIGIAAQSIGGGGGTLTTTTATSTDNSGALPTITVPLQFGDSGGSSGDGGNVTVRLGDQPHPGLDSYVITHGANAYGIFAQSVGGGGGLFIGGTPDTSTAPLFGGNLQTGNGGTVNVTLDNTSYIFTSGAGAVGIFAQSVGGGGGVIGGMQNVNQNSGLQATQQTEQGQGGNIDITVGTNSSVVTTGAGAHAIFAQSVGGGGGVISAANGAGYAFAGANAYDCTAGTCTGNINVVVGASGGGSIVRTSGEGAYGIYVQSRGNGVNNTNITLNSGSQIQSWAQSAGAIYVDGAGTNTIDNFGTIDDGEITNGGKVSANGIIVASATPVAITNESGSVFNGNTALANGSTINGQPGSTLSATSLDLGGLRSTLVNGGKLEVGNTSISSLKINGNLIQQATGQLMLDSDHVAGTGDHVSVTGNATLGGQIVMRPTRLTNSTLEVLDVQGSLDASQLKVNNPYLVNYTVTTNNASSVAGSGQPPVQSLSVTPEATFTANAAGLSKNAQAVADHLQANFDAGAGANALGSAFAQLANGVQNHAAYAATLNRLGNETQQAVGIAGLAASHAFVDRMYECPVFDGPANAMTHEHDCVWGRVIDNHTSSSSSDSVGYSANTYAMQFGGQHRVGDGWFLGGSVGYNTSNLDGSDGVGDINGHGPQVGVVLKKELGNWTFSAGADAAYGWYDSGRNVLLPGYTAQAKGDFNTYEAGLHSRIAYTVPVSNFYMKPYLDLHLVHFHSGSYVEQGAGALDLAVSSSDATTFSTSPMFEVGGRWTFVNGMVLRPDVAVGAIFHTRDHWDADARFVGSAPGVASFSSQSSAPGTLARIKVDMNLSVSKTTEFKLEYGGQFGGGYSSNEGILRVNYLF